MSALKKPKNADKKLRVGVAKQQKEFLEKEAKRMKVSAGRALLIFLSDGRLTPSA